MSLKLKSADHLDNLGINPAVPTDLKAKLRAESPSAIKCPTIGHLIAEAKSLRISMRDQGRKVLKEARYQTALHWRYGKTLKAIRKQCGHGEWLAALVTIGEVDRQGKANRRRAREYVRYTEVFATEADAGKKTVAQANKLIRKFDNSPFANCFATPEWLREAIQREYGFPGLDVCVSHGMVFGERFFAPRNNKSGRGAAAFDGLKQDWPRFCPKGKVIFCNPPFHRSTLASWVTKCWESAQQGYTVVCVLPRWANDDWYQEYVEKYGEVRHALLVAMNGFGPKKGKRSGGGRWNTIVVIFRKDQAHREGPSLRRNQPSIPNLDGFVADNKATTLARLVPPARDNSPNPGAIKLKTRAEDWPESIGRQELIDGLMATLSNLPFDELAVLWEQLHGPGWRVDGERLRRCEKEPSREVASQ